MTRINGSLTKISDELILAELGEIGRPLANVVKIIKYGRKMQKIPPKFTLGCGHVTFFYDKVDYIVERYLKLREEWYMRTKNEYSHDHFNTIMDRYEYIYTNAPHLCNTWIPTEEANQLIIDRILSLSDKYNNHHYYRELITNWKEFLSNSLILEYN